MYEYTFNNFTGKWALAQIVQRSCRVSVPGDTQNLMGYPFPGEQRGRTKQSPEMPSHLSLSVMLWTLPELSFCGKIPNPPWCSRLTGHLLCSCCKHDQEPSNTIGKGKVGRKRAMRETACILELKSAVQHKSKVLLFFKTLLIYAHCSRSLCSLSRHLDTLLLL